MEGDLEYQETVRTLIRSAPIPLPLAASPEDDLSHFVHPGPHFRPTHDMKYNRNGKITPPGDIKKSIDVFWTLNIETPNSGHFTTNSKKYIAKRMSIHRGCSKQELYKLWWLSGDICNKSGVKGDWVVNSHKKLTFDRIIPGARDGMMFADFSCFPYTLIF